MSLCITFAPSFLGQESTVHVTMNYRLTLEIQSLLNFFKLKLILKELRDGGSKEIFPSLFGNFLPPMFNTFP